MAIPKYIFIKFVIFKCFRYGNIYTIPLLLPCIENKYTYVYIYTYTYIYMIYYNYMQ